MDFCPTCANLLLVEGGNMGELRYFCQTCPYVYTIKAKVGFILRGRRKEEGQARNSA